jgi:hypothetical protein
VLHAYRYFRGVENAIELNDAEHAHNLWKLLYHYQFVPSVHVCNMYSDFLTRINTANPSSATANLLAEVQKQKAISETRTQEVQEQRQEKIQQQQQHHGSSRQPRGVQRTGLRQNHDQRNPHKQQQDGGGRAANAGANSKAEAKKD